MSELKYKVGDKFIVEITGIRQGSWPYVMSDGDEWDATAIDKLEPYTAPKRPVWRDGAVEKPTKYDGDIRWMYKENHSNYDAIYLGTCAYPPVNWSKAYWLPANEFPMPTLPEPVIEPCPFCGEKCVVSKHYNGNGGIEYYWIACEKNEDECGYCSAVNLAEQEAINTHNAIARKVKGATK